MTLVGQVISKDVPDLQAKTVRHILDIVSVLLDVVITAYAAETAVLLIYIVHEGASVDIKSASASLGRTIFTAAKLTPSL